MLSWFQGLRVRHALTAAAVATLVVSVPAASQAQAVATAPAVAEHVKVGASIYEVAVSESLDTVYVASTGADQTKIFGLDPQTLAVKTSIDVSAAPAYGLAINNETNTLYTSNTRAGSVSAIDLETGEVLNTISVADNPRAHVFRVLVDEDANMIYVSVAATPGGVWVIDGSTNELAAQIEAGQRTTGLALDKANNRLFAASQGTNEIVVIDLATRQVAGSYPSGGERTTQLAFDPATNRLFATHQATGNLTVLDATSGEVLRTIETGETALGVAFNPTTNQIYVANRGAGTVTVVDGESYDVVANLEAGTLPNTVAVDSRTGFVYVTNKARGGGRGRGAAADVPVPPDEGGDTVTLIRP